MVKHRALIEWLLANANCKPGKSAGGYSPDKFRKAAKLIEGLGG